MSQRHRTAQERPLLDLGAMRSTHDTTKPTSGILDHQNVVTRGHTTRIPSRSALTAPCGTQMLDTRQPWNKPAYSIPDQLDKWANIANVTG